MADTINISNYKSVGGTDTHMIMRISYNEIKVDEYGLSKNVEKDLYVFLGTVISISYSVYRNKKAVHNLGNKVISGYATGPRYVAGTIIKGMFLEDDIAQALQALKDQLKEIDRFATELALLNLSGTPSQISNLMFDDILSCDIIVLYASEYGTVMKKEVIQGATFINNGQVMSVNDLITETTISYIAQDIIQHEEYSETISSYSGTNTTIKKASQLI